MSIAGRHEANQLPDTYEVLALPRWFYSSNAVKHYPMLDRLVN